VLDAAAQWDSDKHCADDSITDPRAKMDEESVIISSTDGNFHDEELLETLGYSQVAGVDACRLSSLYNVVGGDIEPAVRRFKVDGPYEVRPAPRAMSSDIASLSHIALVPRWLVQVLAQLIRFAHGFVLNGGSFTGLVVCAFESQMPSTRTAAERAVIKKKGDVDRTVFVQHIWPYGVDLHTLFGSVRFKGAEIFQPALGYEGRPDTADIMFANKKVSMLK
jgi:hypothetical protein